MTLRVLHIFSPHFRQRFGGPIYNWNFYFTRWNHPSIEHYVLDTEADEILPARVALAFELKGDQKIVGKAGRLTWVLRLWNGLIKYRQDYDLVHYHVLWWGSLLTGWWLQRHQVPTLYESVLLGSDTPGAIIEERLGRVKLRLLHNFSGILAISDQIAQDYLGYGFMPENVYTNMNCLNTNLFHPPEQPQTKDLLRSQFNLTAEAFVLLYVGSLIQRKGVDLLVDAFIKAQRQNSQLHLWLVGPQNKHENPSLDESFVFKVKQLVATAGLENVVTFAGLVAERKTLAEVYRTADAFVFPSRKEGLPNVVLEAMASGLPVIVSDLPGLKKVVNPCKTGVVIPIGDIDALENAIVALVSSKTGKKTLGEAARAYILENHSFDPWQAKMAQIYKQLLQTKRKS